MKHAALLFPLVFLLACGDDVAERAASPAAPLGEAARAGSRSASGSGADDDEVADDAAPPISRTDVDALLARWVDAQNRGDFGDYEDLYAERFHGVRRTGVEVRPFDRAGWLEDRHRMFERAMVVRIESVRVTTTAHDADVTFVQRWQSGRYEDVGPKHMLLVRSPDGLRIAVEEMLRSERPSDLEASLASGAFLVVREGGRSVVVFGSIPASDTAGDILLVGERESVAVAREYRGAVPPALASLAGVPLPLITPGGTCEATTGPLRAFRFVTPHFGEVARWHGTGDFAGERPVPDAERAREAWEHADQTYVGALLEGECADAVLALRPGARAPLVYPVREVPPGEWRPYVDSFARTSGGRRIESEYEAYLAGLHDGEEHAATDWRRGGEGTLAVRAYGTGARPKAVSVDYIAGACGGFDGRGWTVFEVQRDDSLDATSLRGLPPYATVRAVFDLEGDGELEAVVQTELRLETMLVRLGHAPGLVRRVAITYRDCPC